MEVAVTYVVFVALHLGSIQLLSIAAVRQWKSINKYMASHQQRKEGHSRLSSEQRLVWSQVQLLMGRSLKLKYER
jgi:hypothetical protein